jgi:hypothetical protein
LPLTVVLPKETNNVQTEQAIPHITSSCELPALMSGLQFEEHQENYSGYQTNDPGGAKVDY